MSGAWAVRLGASDARRLGLLRRRPEIEVLGTDDAVWLRGESLDEVLDKLLRGLPGARRFGVLPDGQLVPAGAIVPEGRLPDGSWSGIASWIIPELAPPAFAGKVGGKVSLGLVRSSRPKESNVLWTTLAAWHDWAERAGQVRLDRLAFTVSGALGVVVRGSPLPPIKGRRFVETGGVAVEAGWAWSPPVDADVVGEVLGLAPGDLALLHPDGSWDQVPGEVFVRATRSAVRMSAGIR